MLFFVFFFQAEDGIRDLVRSRGLGDVYKRQVKDSFRLELAHALLARQLFPEAPLKWMPPTKHMTGDIFRGYLPVSYTHLTLPTSDLV